MQERVEAIPEQSLSEDRRVRATVKTRASASVEPSVPTSKPANPCMHLAFPSHGDRDPAGTGKEQLAILQRTQTAGIGITQRGRCGLDLPHSIPTVGRFGSRLPMIRRQRMIVKE